MAPGEPSVGYRVVGVAVASAEVMTHPVVVAAAASTTDTSASRPVTMSEAHAPLATSGPKIPEDPLTVELTFHSQPHPTYRQIPRRGLLNPEPRSPQPSANVPLRSTQRIARFRSDWDLYWSCNRSCLWRPGRR